MLNNFPLVPEDVFGGQSGVVALLKSLKRTSESCNTQTPGVANSLGILAGRNGGGGFSCLVFLF